MHHYLTVSEVARRHRIPPRRISDLFYQRKLDDDVCPVVAGRRLIPVEYLPVVEAALRSRGTQQEDAAACAPAG